MRNYWLMLIVLPGPVGGAEVEIHRCALADGSIAFQEVPCDETANDKVEDTDGSSESAAVDDVFDFVNPFDAAEDAPTQPQAEKPLPPSPVRAECEKTTRDAIDAIDVEMRKGYTEEQGRQYLAELLELTRQLRACKQSNHAEFNHYGE